MNWTSSLLIQSDTRAIVPHLLLSPLSTVVKPAEHEFVRRPRLVAHQTFDVILSFGNLIVFSAGNTLLFINDLVVDDPVGLITCVGLWFSITVTPV